MCKCDKCPIAEKKKLELLKECDSILDAVAEYELFLEECKSKCSV